MSGILLILYLYGSSTNGGFPLVLPSPSREQCVSDGKLYTKDRNGYHNFMLVTQFNFPKSNGNFSCVDTNTKSRYEHTDLNKDNGWVDMK